MILKRSLVRLVAALTFSMLALMGSSCVSESERDPDASTSPLPMLKINFNDMDDYWQGGRNIYTWYTAHFARADIDNYSGFTIVENSTHDRVTDSYYTVPKTGTYAVNVHGVFAINGQWTSSQDIEIGAGINGADPTRLTRITMSSGVVLGGYDRSVQGSTLLEFTAGDVVRIKYYSESGDYGVKRFDAVFTFVQ